ncbi:MAG: glucosaminidase domain-containing protein, partial [Kurthia sp.]
KTIQTSEKTELFSINRSAKMGATTYYELSRMTTAGKNSVVGWVKTTDASAKSVVAAKSAIATNFLNGKGFATNIAGSTAASNKTVTNLSKYAASTFKVTKEQVIGGKTYYLGKIGSKYAWVEAQYFGNPFQYFNLRKVSNVTQAEMEAYLIKKKGTGIKTNNLYKNIPVFLDMQKKYGINAQFMLAHAIWETGWGGSQISQYKNNFFGYQAYDSCAMTCAMYFPTGTDGIQYYADAIYRKYLRVGAIYNNGTSPAGMNDKYATDKTWAYNIARLMQEMKPYDGDYYESAKPSTIDPKLPTFNYSNVIPTTSAKPTSYHSFDAGVTATVSGISPRAQIMPYPYGATVQNYTAGQKVLLDGTNNDVSLKWMRIIVNGKEAWISRSSLVIDNLGQATMEANIRDLPTTSGSKVIATIPKFKFFNLQLDNKGKAVTEKDATNTTWYKVQIPGKKTTGWISSTIVTIYL